MQTAQNVHSVMIFLKPFAKLVELLQKASLILYHVICSKTCWSRHLVRVALTCSTPLAKPSPSWTAFPPFFFLGHLKVFL